MWDTLTTHLLYAKNTNLVSFEFQVRLDTVRNLEVHNINHAHRTTTQCPKCGSMVQNQREHEDICSKDVPLKWPVQEWRVSCKEHKTG